MTKVIVSACLIGENCRYDGGNCQNNRVLDYLKDKEYIWACPEQLGGLSTPRFPCERKEDKVINNEDQDVTAAFKKGAQSFIALARAHNCTLAIMKSLSPSCGKGLIYDGTFSGKMKEDNGVTTELLLENNIEVIADTEV